MVDKDTYIMNKEIEFDKLKLKKVEFDDDVNLENHFKNLTDLINKKQEVIENLEATLIDEVNVNIDYQHKYDDMLLSVDFPEVLNEKRPNKEKKEAYINNKLKGDYDNKELLDVKVHIIKKQLELLDNRINLERDIIKNYKLISDS